MLERRVVITGMGVVSPIGNNICEFTKSLKEGKNGIDKITKFENPDVKVKVIGEVRNLNYADFIDKKEMRRLDDFSIYALIAAKEAMEDSKILDSSIDKNRFGVYVGSGIGGINSFIKNHLDSINKGVNRVSPFFIPSMISNMASGLISIKYDLRGPTLPIVTACATSTNSIGEAYRNIKDGYSDAIVTGGCEGAISELTVSGFSVLGALSKSDDKNNACIPFDEDRSGFVMSEGAGILILEEYESAKKRNAKIYAEIVGYGNTSDAYHITSPREDADGAIRSIREAIGEHSLDAEKLYYNAHGTSTLLNDSCETKALKEVFKEDAYKLSISSTKSMTGHMLGATGAVEVIASVIALTNGFIPPTINTKKTSMDCDLDYTLKKAKKKDIDYALSTSLGFGGHNASILLKKVL